MKTQLSLRLIRFVLFCTAATLTVVTGTSAFAAQTRPHKARNLRLAPVIVEAGPLTPPDLVADETVSSPASAMVALPLSGSDGSIALPDGSLLILPARANSDGTVILPDGTTALRSATGTLTHEDGSSVDLNAKTLAHSNE
jgi:hypothetical protein